MREISLYTWSLILLFLIVSSSIFSQETKEIKGTYHLTHAFHSFKLLGFLTYTDANKKPSAIYLCFDKEPGNYYKIDNGETISVTGIIQKAVFGDGKEYDVLMVSKTIFKNTKERSVVMTEEQKMTPLLMAGAGLSKAQLTYKINGVLDRRKISDVVKEKDNKAEDNQSDNIKIDSTITELKKKDIEKIKEVITTTEISSVGVTSITKQQAQEALNVHNAERKLLGINPLKWSPKLAQVAQEWANKLAREGCDLEHSDLEYGENLFGGWGAIYTPKDAALSWLDEKSVFGKYSWWPDAAHYSQMIWNTTNEVGMATATCPDGSMVIVAEYDPVGNNEDKSPY